MRIPSDKQLLNNAYRIATGNFLTQSFSFARFQRIKTMNYITEDYEHWDENSINSEISGLASSIYNELSLMKQKMKEERAK